MNEIEITIEAGKSKRLLTKGKLCDENIVVTAEGGVDRYEEGVTDGKQQAYDTFWDSHQRNGTQQNYSAFFAGRTWTEETLCPKYDIVPTNAYQMFYICGADSNPIDLTSALKVKLDFSKATNIDNVFQGANISRVGVIDVTSCGASITAVFANASLHTIDEFVIKTDGSQSFGNSFSGCSSLENLTIKGTIGKTFTINNSARLSSKSVQSIIDHLKDLTGTTAQTLTLHRNVGAKLTEEQKATITAKNWALVY